MRKEMTRTPSTGGARRSRRALAASLLLLALVVVAAAQRLVPSTAQAATVAVTIQGFSFKPKAIHIKVGDSVTWANKETKQTHTVIQDDGAWSSDGDRPNDPDAEVKPGSSFTHEFDTDNATYPYHCRLHTYMTGTVIVGKGSPAGQPPPAAPTEDPAASPTPQGPLPPWAPPVGGTGAQHTAIAPAIAVRAGRVQPANPGYTPTELPQGVSGPGTLGDGTRLAPYTKDKDGVKEFHLRMAPITWTTSPGNTQTAYAFNGTIPGPVIRVIEGDRLRILVTNDLPVATSVHWHGMILPNDQDGVPGITQPLIAPGSTYTYTWTAVATGTHWYHTHTSGRDEGLGLYGSLEVIPRTGDIPADRDYRVMIGDSFLGLVLNGKTFPYTYPLKAKVGERVHIRLIDTGDMVHPIHIHGFPFLLVARDGIRLTVPEWMDTTLIGTGQTLDLIWQPMTAGNWLFHCHIFAHSHDENGMTGLVTVFEVAPADSPIPGAAPPLPALPALPGSGTPPPYGTFPVPVQAPATGLLPPSAPASSRLIPAESGGILGANQETVLIAVGLLLAYRLGRRSH
jgi:FtsP/CotA-like multicopper oxidase with cupredoxin domain